MPIDIQIPGRDLNFSFPDETSNDEINQFLEDHVEGREGQLENEKWRAEMAQLAKGPRHGALARTMNIVGRLNDLNTTAISMATGALEFMKHSPSQPYYWLSKAFGKDPLGPAIDYLNRAKSEISDVTQVIPEADESFVERLAADVTGGIGSTLAFMGGGAPLRMLKMGGMTSAATLGAFAGFNDGYNRALEAGEDETGAYFSGLFNAGVGTTEAFPVGKWINQAAKRAGVKKLSHFLKEAGEEGLQELFQSAAGDIYAGLATKEQVDAWEAASNALYSGLVGAISGGVVSAGMHKTHGGTVDYSMMTREQFREAATRWLKGQIESEKIRLGQTGEKIQLGVDPSQKIQLGRPPMTEDDREFQEIIDRATTAWELSKVKVSGLAARIREEQQREVIRKWEEIQLLVGRVTMLGDEEVQAAKDARILAAVEAEPALRLYGDGFLMGSLAKLPPGIAKQQLEAAKAKAEAPKGQEQAAKPAEPEKPAAKPTIQPADVTGMTLDQVVKKIQALNEKAAKLNAQLMESGRNAEIARTKGLAGKAKGKEARERGKGLKADKSKILTEEQAKKIAEERDNVLRDRANLAAGGAASFPDAPLAMPLRGWNGRQWFDQLNRPVRFVGNQPVLDKAEEAEAKAVPVSKDTVDPQKSAATEQAAFDRQEWVQRFFQGLVRMQTEKARRAAGLMTAVAKTETADADIETIPMTMEELDALHVYATTVNGILFGDDVIDVGSDPRPVSVASRLMPAQPKLLRPVSDRELQEADYLYKAFIEDMVRNSILRISPDPSLLPDRITANAEQIMLLADTLLQSMNEEIAAGNSEMLAAGMEQSLIDRPQRYLYTFVGPESRAQQQLKAHAELVGRRNYLRAAVNYYRHGKQANMPPNRLAKLASDLGGILGVAYDPTVKSEPLLGDPKDPTSRPSSQFHRFFRLLQPEQARAAAIGPVLRAFPDGVMVTMRSPIDGKLQVGVVVGHTMVAGRPEVIVRLAQNPTPITVSPTALQVQADAQFEAFDPVYELGGMEMGMGQVEEADFEHFTKHASPRLAWTFDPNTPIGDQRIHQVNEQAIGQILQGYGQTPGVGKAESYRKLKSFIATLNRVLQTDADMLGLLPRSVLDEMAEQLGYVGVRPANEESFANQLQAHAQIIDQDRVETAKWVVFKDDVMEAFNQGRQISDKTLKSLGKRYKKLARYIADEQVARKEAAIKDWKEKVRWLASLKTYGKKARFGSAPLPVFGWAADGNGAPITNPDLIARFRVTTDGFTNMEPADVDDLAKDFGANEKLASENVTPVIPEGEEAQARPEPDPDEILWRIVRDPKTGRSKRVRVKASDRKRAKGRGMAAGSPDKLTHPVYVMLSRGNKAVGYYRVKNDKEATELINFLRREPKTVRQRSPEQTELNKVRAQLKDLTAQREALRAGPQTGTVVRNAAALDNQIANLQKNVRGLQGRIARNKKDPVRPEIGKSGGMQVSVHPVSRVKGRMPDKPISRHVFKNMAAVDDFIKGKLSFTPEWSEELPPVTDQTWWSVPKEGRFLLEMHYGDGSPAGYYRFHKRKQLNGYIRALLRKQGITNLDAMTSPEYDIAEEDTPNSTGLDAHLTVSDQLAVQRGKVIPAVETGALTQGPTRAYKESTERERSFPPAVQSLLDQLRDRPPWVFTMMATDPNSTDGALIFSGIEALQVVNAIAAITGTSEEDMREHLIDMGRRTLVNGEPAMGDMVPGEGELWEDWSRSFMVYDLRDLDPRDRTIEDDDGVLVPDGAPLLNLLAEAVSTVMPAELKGGEATGVPAEDERVVSMGGEVMTPAPPEQQAAEPTSIEPQGQAPASELTQIRDFESQGTRDLISQMFNRNAFRQRQLADIEEKTAEAVNPPKYVRLRKAPHSGLYRVVSVEGEYYTIEREMGDQNNPQQVQVNRRELSGVALPDRQLTEEHFRAMILTRQPVPGVSIEALAAMGMDEIRGLAGKHADGKVTTLGWRVGRNLRNHRELRAALAAYQNAGKPWQQGLTLPRGVVWDGKKGQISGETQDQARARQDTQQFWGDVLQAAMGTNADQNSTDATTRGLFNDPTYQPPFPDGMDKTTSHDMDSGQRPPPDFGESQDAKDRDLYGAGLGAALAGEVTELAANVARGEGKPTRALEALRASPDYLRDFPHAKKMLDEGLYVPISTPEYEAAASKIVDLMGGSDLVSLQELVHEMKRNDMFRGLGEFMETFVLMEVVDRLRNLASNSKSREYLAVLDEVQSDALKTLQSLGSIRGQLLSIHKAVNRRFTAEFWVRKVVRKEFEDRNRLQFLTPEMEQRWIEMTRKIQNLGGTARDKMIEARDTEIRDALGYTMWDKAWSWWYASVLSGLRTHVDNVLMGANTLAEAALLAVARPRAAGAIASGYLRGLEFGFRRFGSWFHGSNIDRMMAESDTLADEITEDVAKYGADPLGWVSRHSKSWIARELLSKARYVQHFMAATDSTLAHASFEARAAAMAYDRAAENLTRQQEAALERGEAFEITDEMIDEAASEILSTTAEDIRQVEEQVDREIAEGMTLESERKVRVLKLLKDRRPDDLNITAKLAGMATVGNAEPYGMVGHFYRAMLGIRKGFPLVRPVVPFLRWSANFTNILMDWMPPTALARVWMNSPSVAWGKQTNDPVAKSFASAFNAFAKTGNWVARKIDRNHKQVTGLDYTLLRLKALTGTLAMWGLFELLRHYDDDDEPAIQLVGGLYGMDPNRKRQLLNQGIRPWSIRINGTNISYRNLPFAALLGLVGSFKDGERYGNTDENWEERLLKGMFHGATMVKDMSVMATLSDVIGIMADNRGSAEFKARTIVDIFSRFATGFVSPNIFREIDYWFDSVYYDAQTWSEKIQRDIAFMRHLNDRPVYNALGEEVRLERKPWSRVVTSPEVSAMWESVSVKANQGVWLPAVTEATIFEDGKRRRMTPEELYQYQAAVYKLQGELMAREHAWFRNAEPEAAQRWLDRQSRRIRERVRNQFGWR